MKTMFNAGSSSLGVKTKLYEAVLVQTVAKVEETWGMKMDKKHKLDGIGMQC